MDYSKVIVALDNFSSSMAEEIIDHWEDRVFGFKINHTLYPEFNKKEIMPKNIFVDYKLFDIPNTMNLVVEQLIDKGVEMVTVHMNNNQKAIQSLSQYANKIKLLGVTYLTSWDAQDLEEVYFQSKNEIYKRSIALMEDNGFWGAICSPQDLKCFNGSNLKKICPGIRFYTDSKDDQKRTATPDEAIKIGADYLVMGRSFFNNI